MLDEIDKRLLSALQADAQATAQDLAEVLNLSASQIGRRRQRLEALGLIRGYAARLDAQKLGLSVQAFIQVQMTTHGTEPARGFAAFVARQPQVVSAWTLTGEADYLLRVYCADLPALNRLIHDVLLVHPAVARVQSQIVMHQFKQDAALPI
ncbi:MAG: AsnC family transcriptional regulator [Rhodobacteraceae bacterium HLUCCA08]|nr:MAG: AsnC family transcriptional regulator [Rhodobacteraceae bacterium HLUCCA08]